MPSKRIRYAVVGLGHIAQVAILPAFAHASENSELSALVSGDAEKLRKLGHQYGIEKLHGYEDYDSILRSGEVDAVYIALPNSMHEEYTIRAAKAGVHVLCEKPMAVTARECEAMIRAARENNVKLMVAYRLHFEEANLAAVKLVASGKLGELRLFSSVFTMNVKKGNIRLDRNLGGGVLYDIGIYCINAARYLFRSEPIQVNAISESRKDPRFREVPEMVSAMLRFPENRIGAFTVSFGAASSGSYSVVGTSGELQVEPAYSYATDINHRITSNGKRTEKTFRKRDQFAPQLVSFSNHILRGSEPEPSGTEGLIDVMIIEALHESIEQGAAMDLDLPKKDQRPDLRQEMERAPVKEPETVKVSAPKKD